MQLWNPAIESFAVKPLPPPHGQTPPVKIGFPFVQINTSCHINATRNNVNGTLVGVRELLGFVPWYFSTGENPLIPYARTSDFISMFEQLFDVDGFEAEWGK